METSILKKYKVIIADDHHMFRQGLKAMLESHECFEVIGEVDNGKEAVIAVGKTLPDLVIMDLSMDGLDGFEATETIKKEHDKTKVIILSMHSHENIVDKAIQRGASAFLVKEDAFGELLEAVETVFLDKTYFSVSLNKHNHSKGALPAPSAAVLTERELEVLKYLSEGWPNKAIAAHLDITVKTVEAHRTKLMRKLKIYSTAQLTKFAIREGIVSL